MKTLSLCLLIALALCWGCGDPPNSVMEMVLPDKDMPAEEPPAVTMADVKTTPAEAVTAAEQPPETPPVTINDTAEPPGKDVMMPLFEIEAIFATVGEVHSPIPDDVYEDLWGHWTLAGLSTPRSYYTQFIDAGGIAIVGGDTIPNGVFQEARHIVLVMTAKLPELRKALSRKTKTSVRGRDIPFRVVIREGLYESYPGEVDPDPEASLRRVLEAIPERSKGGTISGTGQFYAYPLCVVDGGTRPDGSLSLGSLVHEFAHAIHGAFIDQPHLLPDIQFTERLGNTWERQMEHFRKREEEGLPLNKNFVAPYAVCWGKNTYGNVNVWEHWAYFVDKEWFARHGLNSPEYLAKYPPPEYGSRRENCGELVDLASDVFPAFPLHMAKNQIDYTRF